MSTEAFPPEPGGRTPREFGGRLKSLLQEHRDIIYASVVPGSVRPTETLGNTAVQVATGIHRRRVGEILGGIRLPRLDELEAMLTIINRDEPTRRAWTSALHRLSSGRGPALAAAQYDAQTDGLFMKGAWNGSLGASRDQFQVLRVDPPKQSWVSQASLVKAGAGGPGAEIPYIVRVDVDHRESADTDVCRIEVAIGRYADARAINRLRVIDASELALADRQLNSNLDGYLSSAVPSSLNVNVVPVTLDGLAICVRRSAGVESAQGCWTAGIVETMKASDASLHDLAERGLRDELAIDVAQIRELRISWLGFYRPVLRGHVVAVASVLLTAEEVIRGAMAAEERYEAAAFDAITPLDLWAELADLSTVASDVDAHPTLVGPTRQWVDHSRLAAAETLAYFNGLGT